MRFVRFKSNVPEAFGTNRSRPKKLVAVVAKGLKPATTPRVAGVAPLALYENGVADERHQDCHRGHLIALEFGGPDAKENLVPMYGGFNANHGLWRQLEGEIDTWVNANDGDEVTIECAYSAAPGDDPRIPFSFTVTAKSSTKPQTFSKTLQHPKPPPPIPHGADQAKKAAYILLRTEMETAGWLIENNLGNMDDMPAYRRMPVFQPKGATIWRSRPYAFLDYEAWKAVKDDVAKLGRWRNGIFGAATADFKEELRSKIKEVNLVLNDGYLVSDDPFDPVYTQLKYRVPGLNPGILVEGGHDMAPAVDHVVPQSMAGLAVYSNAMLISTKRNSDKRASVSAAVQTAIASSSKPPARTSKPVVRYDPYKRN